VKEWCHRLKEIFLEKVRAPNVGAELPWLGQSDRPEANEMRKLMGEIVRIGGGGGACPCMEKTKLILGGGGGGGGKFR